MCSSVSQIEALLAVRDVLRHGFLWIKAKSRHRIWLSVKISLPEPLLLGCPSMYPRPCCVLLPLTASDQNKVMDSSA